MATQRKTEYPAKLDKIAEQFNLTPPELIEAIANGQLIVSRADVSESEIAEDDALWEEQFGQSDAVLNWMVAKAMSEYRDGETLEFDPDTDPDFQ